ncbi:MAG: hypothetical protein M3347_11680 [Armatimonadota bacterium]|nr:hypothetical protein [Armatimonadota bacterium]
MKQIGLAVIQYTQDYDEYYFPTQPTTASSPGADAYTFASLLLPYTKSDQLFICPSGSRTIRDNTMGAPIAVADYKWVMNSPPWAKRAEGHYAFLQALAGRALSDVPAPATTGMICDAGWYLWNSTFDNAVQGSTRHLEGSNFGYADGHVKWQAIQKNPAAVCYIISTCP